MRSGEIIINNASKVQKPDVLKIVDIKLKSIIERNYRNSAEIWNWSTADAIRYTKQYWELVWWTDHLQKRQDTINWLQKLLNKSTLNIFDTKVAKSILNDIKNAMKWK